jgi:hypothetical protein
MDISAAALYLNQVKITHQSFVGFSRYVVCTGGLWIQNFRYDAKIHNL